MSSRSRKFYVTLISLGGVFVIFLLYSRISETPQIEVDTGAEFPGVVVDSNAGDFGSKIGKVGDVSIGTVQVARFTDFNKNKKVEREFGFEKLLGKEGSEWEIEKPYMNIFRRNFKCYITADKGEVRVETTAGNTGPKDATFTGNVIIHILPENSSDIKESFIYLDDVVFISEKSQFSTAGPVKFVSENAQMFGRGLEIVYNNALDRLEFLRMIHLETLRLKRSKAALFGPVKTEVDGPIAVGVQPKTPLPDELTTAEVHQKAMEIPATGREAVGQSDGEGYRCVFGKNVVINTPEQLVFADEVSISNISSKSGKSEQVKSDVVDTNEPEKHDEAVTKQSEPNESAEQFFDIVVTCDNGIVVTPMDSPVLHTGSAKIESEKAVTDDRYPKSVADSNGRTVLVAEKIDYRVPTGYTVASGPAELTFGVDDVIDTKPNGQAVPVKLTARKKIVFLPTLNQVVFEGDCLCTMLREYPDSQQEYTLSAPKLTFDLSREKNLAADIKHLTADGGVVQFATVKKAEGKLLGFTKLRCFKFDYDTVQQLFLASKGVMAVDNSRISEPDTKVGRFSLQRPCWAIVDGFDTLKYFLKANRVVADAESQRIFIDYIPIVEGQYGQKVTASAGHIEANLIETVGGRTEISTLNATGGVSYDEEAREKKWGKSKKIEFMGSEFFYDVNKSMITAWGDDFQPCFLNGSLVEGIEYNLKTEKLKVGEIIGGVLQ
jgi:hypothetical protein